jgi:hypothetical protein
MSPEQPRAAQPGPVWSRPGVELFDLTPDAPAPTGTASARCTDRYFRGKSHIGAAPTGAG